MGSSMNQIQLTSVGLLIFAGFIAAFLSAYGWRCRPAPGSKAFTVLMAAVVEWSFLYALEIASVPLGDKVLWAKLEYFGIVTIPLVWVLFAIDFTETRTSIKYDGLHIFIVPQIITLILVLSNEYHHLIWTKTALDSSGKFLIVTGGFWYWINLAYSYLLIVIGTVLIIRRYYRAKYIYREQMVALVIGVSAPWVANALYIFDLTPIMYLDLTPFAFTVTGAAFAWGFYHSHLLDIVPVARDTVIERMDDLIIVTDNKGRVVEINPAALRLLGITPRVAVGERMQEVFKGWPELVECLLALEPIVGGDEEHAGPKENSVPLIPFAKEDKRLYFDLRMQNVQDRSGRYRGHLVVLRDITARVEVEDKLRKAHDGLEGLVAERTADLHKERDLLNHIMETSPVGIIRMDRDGRITFVNGQAATVLGLPKEKIVGCGYNARDWKISSLDGGPFPSDALPFPVVMRTGKSLFDCRHAIEQPSGKRILLSINASPLLDDAGKVQGVVATIEDITKRVEDEKSLKESEVNYRSVFEGAKDGLLVIDPADGAILDLNQRTCDIVGYNKDDIKGFALKKLFPAEPPYSFEEAYKMVQRAFKEGTVVFEWKMRRKDGTTVFVEVGLTRTAIGSKDRILAVVRDISDRKIAEKEKHVLLMAKARAEVMGFLVSALPVFASGIPPEARAVLVKNFGERFERIVKDRFLEDLKTLHLDSGVVMVEGPEVGMLFDVYLEWLAALFSSFGTQAKARPGPDHGHLELLACPWVEAAKGNPVFCLICRTMVMRSFTWTGLEGNAEQKASIAGGAQTCWFDFFLQPQGKDRLPEKADG